MADAGDRRIHNRPIYPSAVPGTNSGGSGSSRPRSPVEQWFEVFVYAPLGFALDARQLFPRFVDRGRNQVVLAKVIGKYAVEHGSKQVEGYLGQSQTQVAAVLQALGVLPEESEPTSTTSPSPTTTTSRRHRSYPDWVACHPMSSKRSGATRRPSGDARPSSARSLNCSRPDRRGERPAGHDR